MTSKERVLTTFSNQEADRVPINYSANPGDRIDRRLKAHFGLKADDLEGLREVLGVGAARVPEVLHRARLLRRRRAGA